MAPNNEYLLLLAHPAIKILITNMDDTAEIYSTPILIFHSWKSLAKAMGAISSMATIMAKKERSWTGIYPRRRESCLPFTNNFTVSAKDCIMPLGPTRFGPRRIWIHADTLRSIITNIKPSTANKPITATPAITISTTSVQVAFRWALNHSSIILIFWKTKQVFIFVACRQRKAWL